MIDNSLSEYWFALSKDAPGKAWWNAAPLHPATYRALRIDPKDTCAVYAVHPFRLARIDDRPTVLAAYPAPRILDDPEHEWLGIETVIAWDPVSDRAMVVGDDSAQLVGNLSDDANTIFASPRAFFQGWAIRRAQFAVQRQQARQWDAKPSERDEVPGALLIGAMADVTLKPGTMPEHIQCQGLDPKALNRAILKAARLPRVSAHSNLRAAA